MNESTPSWVLYAVGGAVGFGVVFAAGLGLLVGALKFEDRVQRRNRERATR